MPRVRLSAPTDEERLAFVMAHPYEFAEDMVEAGEWAPDEALDAAWQRLEPLLDALLRDDPHRLLAAREGDRLVGWVWTGPPPAARAGPGRVWLYRLEVVPEARGRGYGRATLDALHARLGREGWRECWLNVLETNLVARSLYASSGYRTMRRYPASRHMRRRL